jgi:DnaK suppressor protein
MTKKELESYREKLLALGRRLRGDMNAVGGEALRGTGGEPAGNLSNAPLHPADLGTDAFEQEMAVGLLENERLLLRQTAEALVRIDQGTYGRCLECGKDIPAARLDALPYTPHCVDCARKLQAEGGPPAPSNL